MDLLNKKQLAKELNVSVYAIDKYIKEGFEPKIKKPLRFTLEDYIEWDKRRFAEKNKNGN